MFVRLAVGEWYSSSPETYDMAAVDSVSGIPDIMSAPGITAAVSVWADRLYWQTGNIRSTANDDIIFFMTDLNY